MSAGHLTFLDRCIAELDTAVRVSCAPARTSAANPADDAPPADAELGAAERDLSARLMRVNHAGEIAAQALYRGQALVAGDSILAQKLLRAADEEHTHLAWCQARVTELGSHVSYLTPLWYGGSFLIGVAAGLAGDRTSLGFLAETEKQVTDHLDGHLQKLPESDGRSRRILEKMREDEIQHGTNAMASGGGELPEPAKSVMRYTSRIMTTLAYEI
jgi:ubiquinone biosynthesis monooxygenase Coq7